MCMAMLWLIQLRNNDQVTISSLCINYITKMAVAFEIGPFYAHH